jgi:hypothetical protein
MCVENDVEYNTRTLIAAARPCLRAGGWTQARYLRDADEVALEQVCLPVPQFLPACHNLHAYPVR